MRNFLIEQAKNYTSKMFLKIVSYCYFQNKKCKRRKRLTRIADSYPLVLIRREDKEKTADIEAETVVVTIFMSYADIGDIVAYCFII